MNTSQAYQIKAMLLSDMPSRDWHEYAEASATYQRHQRRSIVWAVCVLALIPLPVLVGVFQGWQDNGFDFFDVFTPCIWAHVAYQVITMHVLPVWKRDEQTIGKMRREMRRINARPVRMWHHDRLERWRNAATKQGER